MAAKAEIRGLAVGVVALAVALLASGCTTAGTPSAKTGSTTIATPATIAPTTAAPATVPAATSAAPTTGAPTTAAPASAAAATSAPPATASAPATVAPQAATRVEIFNPWTAAGTLSPGITVAGHVSGTGCAMGSFFGGGKYAWRCSQPGGGFIDPCFAPPARSGVTQVACMDSPWSGATIMTLAKPLAHSSWGTPRPSAGRYAWAMVLADGQRCGLIEGTAPVIDDIGLYFGCTGGYASEPSAGTGPRAGTEPWTVNCAAIGAHSLTKLAVATAWE